MDAEEARCGKVAWLRELAWLWRVAWLRRLARLRKASVVEVEAIKFQVSVVLVGVEV